MSSHVVRLPFKNSFHHWFEFTQWQTFKVRIKSSFIPTSTKFFTGWEKGVILESVSGIFDNDSLLRALSKTENRYFKTICFRYGTSQHIIKHRKIVVNNTNQSKSMDFSTKMPKMKTTHEWKNVS